MPNDDNDKVIFAAAIETIAALDDAIEYMSMLPPGIERAKCIEQLKLAFTEMVDNGVTMRQQLSTAHAAFAALRRQATHSALVINQQTRRIGELEDRVEQLTEYAHDRCLRKLMVNASAN